MHTHNHARYIFPIYAPLQPMTFPCVINGRTYESFDEYINDMHDRIDRM